MSESLTHYTDLLGDIKSPYPTGTDKGHALRQCGADSDVPGCRAHGI